MTNIKHVLKNALSNASLRVDLRRRLRIISIWIIRRQNVSTYVRRCYRNNKIGKGLERYVARVNGKRERERERGGELTKKHRQTDQQVRFSRIFERNENEKRQENRKKEIEKERGKRKG